MCRKTKGNSLVSLFLFAHVLNMMESVDLVLYKADLMELG